MISLYDAMYRWLRAFKVGTEDETNGRHIIAAEVERAIINRPSARILDVGAGQGRDLSEIAQRLGEKTPEFFAIETNPISVEALRKIGARVVSIDLESAQMPFPDGYFHIIICNQVLEHTKEIFWVVGELARVLEPDGILILGVPNLGSWHNRVALALGQQPPAINVFGPHVRGFTIPGLIDFLQRGGVLDVVKVSGGNFYPFPPLISRPLAKLLPSLSTSSFYVVRRASGANFLDILASADAAVLIDTPYFRGEVKADNSKELGLNS